MPNTINLFNDDYHSVYVLNPNEEMRTTASVDVTTDRDGNIQIRVSVNEQRLPEGAKLAVVDGDSDVVLLTYDGEG